jgi:hypothetical protein
VYRYASFTDQLLFKNIIGLFLLVSEVSNSTHSPSTVAAFVVSYDLPSLSLLYLCRGGGVTTKS